MLPKCLRSLDFVPLMPVGLLIASFLAAALSPFPARSADNPQSKRHHALSLIGEPKYPADFKHFDFVNPEAPKGGKVRIGTVGSFDTLNIFVRKGDMASGIGLVYDSLMDQSLDQPSTSYCQLCEWVSYPDDFSSVTFKLRKEARWHDGKPVTVEDVIFSFNTFTSLHPGYKFYYKNVAKAEKTGPGEVTFRFDVKNNREMPQIMGDLTILPKHYWTGKDQKGQPRDPSKSTLEPPLGSGPYRISSMKRGGSMTFSRVENYWARDMPVSKGRNNFDEITFIYYHDDTVALEAFKSGGLDFRQETSSKNWATAYHFPAFNRGLVKKQKVELKTGQPMQAFVFNTRRNKFKDPRVRRAFNLAFNFEWANQNLFYGQYQRVKSYFENTELASRGLPSGQELQILNEVKDLVPPEVFTTEYILPENDDPKNYRKNLRKATKLLAEAQWKIFENSCVFSPTGEVLKVEFLLVSEAFERVVQPYAQSLKKLGIASTIRIVDSSQYVRRLQNFDFDIVVGSFRQSQSPGNEQREYWSSEAADKIGSRNLIGIKNKAVDKLIERVIFAKDRAELVAATRALDRVLLWNHYVVPQWYAPYERIAYWTKFAQPAKLPSQDVGFLSTWWFDKKAADRLAAAGG